MLTEPLLLLAALLTSAASPTRSDLHLPVCKFADTYQFEAVKCTIEFRNSSKRPITVRDLTPGSVRDEISPQSLVVPPEGSAYAEATIYPTHEIGRIHRIFRFQSDEPKQVSANRVAEAVGFVANTIDDPKPTMDFGVVKVAEPPAPQVFRLESREVEQLRIEKILDAPGYVDVRVGSDGHSLIAHIKPDAPWGVHQSDFIKLAINTPKQDQVWVAVHVDVHGEVIPSANPFSLGLFRRGARNEFAIRLNSRSGKDFRVGKIHAQGLRGESSVEPCEPKTSGCKLVRYVVSDEQPRGQIAAVIEVELPDFGRTLPISAWGMFVEKDTKVRNFNEEMKEAAEAESVGSVSRVDPPPALDLKRVMEGGNVEAELPLPPGRGPLLKWRVMHEGLIHGYAVYRANTEVGPFVRINDELIATRSVGTEGANYQWRDTTAKPGSTYWYYIGTISNNGAKEKLSSPQRIVAK